MNSNTKSTNAQGKLKPRSVITREEGELGFFIFPRAQGTGRNGQHFSWGFFSLVPCNPNPMNHEPLADQSKIKDANKDTVAGL